MTLINIMVLLGFLCPVAVGQTPPAKSGPEATQSNATCSVNSVSSNVNIGSMTCSSIDLNLAKLFKSIADGTKRDTSMLSKALAELEELNQQIVAHQQTTVNSAQYGFATSGGILVNPAIYNIFGQPPVGVSFTQEPHNDVFDVLPPNTTDVIISVDHSLEIPAFSAVCDRPCKPWHASYSEHPEHQRIGRGEVLVSLRDNPTVVGMVMEQPSPMGATMKVVWSIETLDDKPVKILSVQAIPTATARRYLANPH